MKRAGPRLFAREKCSPKLRRARAERQNRTNSLSINDASGCNNRLTHA